MYIEDYFCRYRGLVKGFPVRCSFSRCIVNAFSPVSRIKNEGDASSACSIVNYDTPPLFLFFNLHLYNHLADITLADAWSMSVFGEINGVLPRIDLCVGCRTVDIESNVFLLVISG